MLWWSAEFPCDRVLCPVEPLEVRMAKKIIPLNCKCVTWHSNPSWRWVFGPYGAALGAVMELRDECLQGGRLVNGQQDANGSGATKFRSTIYRRSWALVKEATVAGSIPDYVIGTFHWHNLSGRIMDPGLIQSLTKMTTRNISWRVKAAGAYNRQPYHLHVPTVFKSESLTLLDPSGPVQACRGIAWPLTFTNNYRGDHRPLNFETWLKWTHKT